MTNEVISRTIKRTVPATWTQDKLSEFWESAASNVVTTFANKTEAVERLRDIDAALLLIAEHLRQPKNLVVALLLLRTHAVFRTAAWVACSGLLSESYPLIRSVIEHAGYAILIHRDPPLGEVWLRRDESKDAKKRVLKEFKPEKIRAALTVVDSTLLSAFNLLYERTIDWGAHPNEKSLTANMSMQRKDNNTYMQVQYLHGDGLPLDHALRTVAQAGIFALRTFQHTMAERFQLLGLQERISTLGNGL